MDKIKTSKKDKFFLLVILLMLFTFIMAFSQRVTKDKSKNEIDRVKIWKEWINNCPLPEDAVELEKTFSFPGEELEIEGIYMANTLKIFKDSFGNIYLPDNRLHQILMFDSFGKFIKKIGQPGEGPGDFNGPTYVLLGEDCFIIKEYYRLQFFDKNWNTIKILKPKRSRYHSPTLNHNGLIFISPWGRVKPKNLIEVWDQEGNIIKSFGSRLTTKFDSILRDRLELTINNNDELYVAFELLPIIRKYSSDDELIFEKEIEYKVMQKKKKRNLGNYVKNIKGERVGYMPIILSIRAAEDGFFLLSTYPRLEIMKFNRNAELQKVYWFNRGLRYRANDFVFIKKNNEIIFYVLQAYPQYIVDVFKIKSDASR